MDKDKKFNLKDQPFIEITVRAYRSMEKTTSGSKRGALLLKFQDTMTDVGEDGCMGYVAGAVGGVMLVDKRREFDDPYIIKHDDLWYAFQDALEAAGEEFTAMKEAEDEQT